MKITKREDVPEVTLFKENSKGHLSPQNLPAKKEKPSLKKSWASQANRDEKKKNKQTELQQQIEYFNWVKKQELDFPDFRWINGSLNGIRLAYQAAYNAKCAGLRKGIWDINWLLKRSPYSGLHIEMKVKGNTLSDEQSDFGEFLRDNGFFTYVAFHPKEAMRATVDYFNLGQDSPAVIEF